MSFWFSIPFNENQKIHSELLLYFENSLFVIKISIQPGSKEFFLTMLLASYSFVCVTYSSLKLNQCEFIFKIFYIRKAFCELDLFLTEAPSAPGFPHLSINCQKEILPPAIFFPTIFSQCLSNYLWKFHSAQRKCGIIAKNVILNPYYKG